MVTRDTPWPDGTPSWVDLGTGDIPKAIGFYAGAFGWDIEQGGPEMGGYSTGRIDGRRVAGIGPSMSDPAAPSAWSTYIASSDADATGERITQAGGKVLMGPTDVMDLGRMLVAADPAGAAFGVWQAGTHAGVGITREPGTFSWSEQFSRDFEASKAFYAAVFGYTYNDMSAGGFSYATLALGDHVVGGIGGYPPGTPDELPAAWAVYFAVADTDQAVERIAGLGGRVVRAPEDSPYGRMAVVADNQNAVFSLIAS